MWYCTECGGQSLEENPEDGTFTAIDLRSRYSLGKCTCQPLRRVAVVQDEQLAKDIACGIDVFRLNRPKPDSMTSSSLGPDQLSLTSG